MQKAESIYKSLGANERAIIDKIPYCFLKKSFIQLIAFKLKLQWKGWLQYLIPLPLSFLSFLVGITFYFIGFAIPFYFFLIFGVLLLLRILFDIITIKWLIRPKETDGNPNYDKNSIELIKLRRSCRSYQNRKLTKADYDDLMQRVNQHLKEPKFSKKKIRLEYISGNVRVWPVVNASEFLVAIAPKEYDRLAIMDVGRTLQKIVIDATRMGIATCWIGPGADHKSLYAYLGKQFDKEKENIICICAIGYKSRYTPLFIQILNNKFHHRLPLKSLIFTDIESQNPIDVSAHPFNIFYKAFESCQWSPSSYNSQTTRCTAGLDEHGEINRFDFYAVTSSKYYAAIATGIWCANWEMACEILRFEGQFVVLNDSLKRTELPVYDISWLLKNPVSIQA
jgi:nitroreductase